MEIEFEDALLSVNRSAALRIFTKYNKENKYNHLTEQLIVNSLESIGKKWEEGTLALSQVYMAGRICEELVDTLLIPPQKNSATHKAIAITVLDDFHYLGKRMVYSILKASGYTILDYGHSSIPELVERCLNDKIQLLLISVLMLPSALHVKELRKKLNSSGLEVEIAVGGAPFRLDQQLWKEVGADTMGENAADAIRIVSDFIRKGKR